MATDADRVSNAINRFNKQEQLKWRVTPQRIEGWVCSSLELQRLFSSFNHMDCCSIWVFVNAIYKPALILSHLFSIVQWKDSWKEQQWGTHFRLMQMFSSLPSHKWLHKSKILYNNQLPRTVERKNNCHKDKKCAYKLCSDLSTHALLRSWCSLWTFSASETRYRVTFVSIFEDLIFTM